MQKCKIMKKIVAILASLNDSRFIKRIGIFREFNLDLDIYGFERNYKSPNEFPKDYLIHKIGDIKNGSNYIRRVIGLFLSLNKVFKRYSSDVIYYATTFDIAFICFICRRKYIYEVSDMVYVTFPKIIKEICRNIDKILVRNSILSFMTSEGFNEYLFGKNNYNNVAYIHNKMSPYFKGKERPIHHFNSEKIRFSFTGLIRYPNTIFRFAKVIGLKFPQYEFHFYGVVEATLTEDFNHLVDTYSNVFYHGPFKNPDDLESIYAKTDIVVCCYDTTTLNERMAEPNKLYESMYFGTPIVVSENIFLADRVRQLECGYVINPFTDDSIEVFVSRLNIEELESMSRKIYNIPTEYLIDETKLVLKEKLLSLL